MLYRLTSLLLATAATLAPAQQHAQQPAPPSTKLLITHAYILTMAPGQRTPIEGYLTVGDDGRILAVAAGDPPANLHPRTAWDAHGLWLLPGFISAHSHLWQSAFRGLAADQTLTGWLNAVYLNGARHAAPDDFYWFTLDGALDHLQHGMTTAYNFNYGGGYRGPMDVPLDQAISYNGRELRAELDSGIRFIHGIDPGFATPPSTAASTVPPYGLAEARPPLAAFLTWAATQTASTTTTGPRGQRKSARHPKQSIAATPAAADRFLGVMINGVTAFNTTVAQAYLEKALSDEFHLGSQSHYLEAPDTQYDDQTKFRWFLDTGLLSIGRRAATATTSGGLQVSGPASTGAVPTATSANSPATTASSTPQVYAANPQPFLFGHFIHTTPFILAETARANAGMSWNPLSNGRLASGVPDIPAYLKAGLRVGMGVDGEASADLADPFENMRTGLYAIRDKYQDATVLSPYDVLRLATLGSADVLGLADRLGSLEPGKFADFLALDPTRFRTVTDPYASLVFIAAIPDLRRVYLGGNLLVQDGQLLHQNQPEILHEVTSRTAHLQPPQQQTPQPQ